MSIENRHFLAPRRTPEPLSVAEYGRKLWASRRAGNDPRHVSRDALERARLSTLDNYGEDPFRYEPGDPRNP